MPRAASPPRILHHILFAWLFQMVAVHAAAPMPALTLSRTNGPAPLAIFCDATATILPDSRLNTFHELHYGFQFGDDRGEVWGHSGLKKHLQSGGPLAAHVFDEPGTYIIRLRVAAPNREFAETNVTVTVTAPDTHWPAAQTICVSASGDFTGAPAGAQRLTTMPTTFSGRRVLLRRGEAFGPIRIRHNERNVLIGTFGSGRKPRVASVRIGEGQPRSPESPEEITIMDLDITDGLIHQNSGARLLFYRNDLDDAPSSANPRPGNAILIGDSIWYWASRSGPAVPAAKFTVPREVFVVENRILGQPPYSQNILHNIHGIFSHSAFLGNEVGGAIEHSIRIFETYKTVVAHNHIQGRHVDLERSCIKLHAGGVTPFTETFGGFASRHVVIANNVFGHAQDTSQWLLQIAPQNREGHAGPEGVEDVIVENNRFVRNRHTVQDIVLVGRNLGARGNSAILPNGSAGPIRIQAERTTELGNYRLPPGWKGPYFLRLY